MHFAKLAAPLALAGLVAASPTDKRADAPAAPAAPTDADILNYALTLEQYVPSPPYRRLRSSSNANAIYLQPVALRLVSTNLD